VTEIRNKWGASLCVQSAYAPQAAAGTYSPPVTYTSPAVNANGNANGGMPWEAQLRTDAHGSSAPYFPGSITGMHFSMGEGVSGQPSGFNATWNFQNMPYGAPGMAPSFNFPLQPCWPGHGVPSQMPMPFQPSQGQGKGQGQFLFYQQQTGNQQAMFRPYMTPPTNPTNNGTSAQQYPVYYQPGSSI
jgi:hypothetical protein